MVPSGRQDVKSEVALEIGAKNQSYLKPLQLSWAKEHTRDCQASVQMALALPERGNEAFRDTWQEEGKRGVYEGH